MTQSFQNYNTGCDRVEVRAAQAAGHPQDYTLLLRNNTYRWTTASIEDSLRSIVVGGQPFDIAGGPPNMYRRTGNY